MHGHVNRNVYAYVQLCSARNMCIGLEWLQVIICTVLLLTLPR